MTLEPLWHRVPGGTGRYTTELASALDDCPGVDVVGVAARHRHPPRPPWRPPVTVVHQRLPRPVLYEVWTRSGWAGPDRVAGDVDLLHATSVVVPPSRLPLVVTVHDLAFTDARSGFGYRARSLFERGWRRTTERAAAVIVPSRATADRLVAAGLASTPIHVVAEGVRADPVSAEQVAAVRGEHRLERPFVLSVATAEPRKNLAGVLSAFAAVAGRHDVDLVLAGADGWGTDLDELVAGCGAPAERIRPLGFVSDDVLHALYAGAELLCYPSWSEGFGLPVLEAMVHGTAVVTSSTTATAEVCGDAGVTVDPADQAALDAAVAGLLDDDAARSELGARGRRRAAGFTWDRAAEATAEVYAACAR